MAAALPLERLAAQGPAPGFRLVDVTAAAGLTFRHNNGAFGRALLPETLGAGCAFLDYDRDGWQDILFVNGMDWPGHRRRRSTLHLYRNNRNGTFTDVTRAAGLDVELYGMGVAVGDYDNDGFPDIFITCVGQNRLFRNTGKGTFLDVTRTSGLAGRTAFSTSAMWVDFDRDGVLDLFVCNYVKWSVERDVFCSLDGKEKTYCTPEAYHGDTCWLFRNRRNGTFEDAQAASQTRNESAPAAQAHAWRLNLLGSYGGAALVIVATIAAFTYVRTSGPPDAMDPHSVAVNPLNAIGGTAAREIADAISEEIATRLASDSNIVVRPTKRIDIQSSGRSTAFATDGAVQRGGGAIRITLRLLRTSDGVAIWAGSYDEPEGVALRIVQRVSAAAVADMRLRIKGR